jgi:hypothetical protein
MEGMLIDVVIFLAAALIAVPLSIRLGFGSVLGYLLAGVAIGPWVLRLITDVDAILHFAELGIVLMMFVIGLEMQVEKLWAMRRTIFGYGGDDLALACHTAPCMDDFPLSSRVDFFCIGSRLQPCIRAQFVAFATGPGRISANGYPITTSGLVALGAKRVWLTKVRPFCHRI